MKYWLISIFIITIILLLGPKVDLDESINPITLPDHIDIYLQKKENRFTDIRPKTEKIIIWQNPVIRNKTPVSIIYIHGFSASRQEIAPLCDQLASTLGANLYYARLRGHGRNSQAMQYATVNAMLNDTYEAMQIGLAIGHKVIVIASSTGATLATIDALNNVRDYQNSIAAFIFLSPNYGLKQIESELLLLPWATQIVNLVEGKTYQFQPQTAMQANYWTVKYPSKSLIEMMGLVKIIRGKDVQLLQQPILILYSPKDSIINVDAVKNTFSLMGSTTKQLTAIQHSGDKQNHILAGNILSPATTTEVYTTILSFLTSLNIQ